MNKRTTTLLTLLMLLLQSNDTFSMEIKKKSGLSQKERKAALALEKAKRAAELAQAAVEAAKTAPASTPLPPKPPLVAIAPAATWPTDAQTAVSADNEDTTDSESSNDEDDNLQQPEVATAGAASADNEVRELAQATDNLTLDDVDANTDEVQAATQLQASIEAKAATLKLPDDLKLDLEKRHTLKHVALTEKALAQVTKDEYNETEHYYSRGHSEGHLVNNWKQFGYFSHEQKAFVLLRDKKTPNRVERQDMVRKLQYAIASLRKAMDASTPENKNLHTIPAALDMQDDTIQALQTLLQLARLRGLTVDPDTLLLSNEIMQIRDGLSKRLGSLATRRSRFGLHTNKLARKAVKKDLETQNKELDLSDDEYDCVKLCSANLNVTSDWGNAPVLSNNDQ